MPLFDDRLLAYFDAKSGAYSPVSDREATGDKSVTIDMLEKQVLSQKIPLDGFTRAGGAAPDENPAKHIFNVYNIDSKQYLPQEFAIKYPKAEKNELRLYFKAGTGFYPNKGTTWFIFTRDDNDHPFIGFISEERWETLHEEVDRVKAFEVATEIDEEDTAYQTLLSQPEEKRDARVRSQFHYPRSVTRAKNKAKSVGYKCEFDNLHESFLSAITGRPFIEAHHLIPMSKSNEFDTSLDVTANIVILCPNCHRAIHFGDELIKRPYLEKFYHERNQGLLDSSINITLEQLLGYYGI